MISIKEDTTLVGVSELRINIEKILEESKKHKILIEKRRKPIAVLMNIEKYLQMEKTLETLEDFALGYLAKNREANDKTTEYINIEDLIKKHQNKN